MTGFTLKTPKAIAAAVHAVTEIIQAFGIKHTNIRPIVRELSKPFGHRDNNVRAEAQELTIELYRWIGAALMPSLSDLNPVALKELQEKFDSLPNEKPKATRLLRSEKPEDDVPADEENSGDEDVVEEVNNARQAAVGIDPWDLADPADVLGKLPSNFDTNLASKKWKERKETLDNLYDLVKVIRIQEQPFGSLISAADRKNQRRKYCGGDTCNPVYQESLAEGLRAPFAQYYPMVVAPTD